MIEIKPAFKETTRSTMRVLASLAYKVMYCGRRSRIAARSPKRILLLNGAHIGDIVISTSILPVLRSAYPEAKIGFMVGNWSSMVIRDHPAVAWIHCVDHWRNNRSQIGLLSKLRIYRRTRKVSLREIRALSYDMALCVYPAFLPDFMDLAWCANIPVRLGAQLSMFAPLATMLIDWPKNDFTPQGAIQAEVLRPLGLDKSHFQKRKATLPESTEGAIQEVCALLQTDRIENTKYRVIHMGSGAANRELPPEFWHEVAETLSKSYLLLFTGRGELEANNIVLATAGLSRCINACGKLSWNGFVAAVRYADMVYGVESMAGHVAAAVGTRCVVAYTGIGGVACWRPESKLATVFTEHVPCAPCKNIHGCKEMTCLRKVRPQDLLSVD